MTCFVWPDGLPRPSLHGDPTVTLRQMYGACSFHCGSCLLATRPLCPLFLQLRPSSELTEPLTDFWRGPVYSSLGGFATSALWAGMSFPPPALYKLTLTHCFTQLQGSPSRVVTPSSTCFHTLQHFTPAFPFCVPFCLSPEINSPFPWLHVGNVGNYIDLLLYVAQSGYLGF